MPNEKVFAFMDDVYMATWPERVGVGHTTLGVELFRHAGIHIHEGKTKVWTVLGAHPEFVAAHLARTVKHEVVPSVQDLQSALTRVLPPQWAAAFASRLLNVVPDQVDAIKQAATIPLVLGGLGLRSAVRTSLCVYWASWADSLPMIRERHPSLLSWKNIRTRFV